jgi:methylmalonyl-CoA mutase N-terminal domain/subunit
VAARTRFFVAARAPLGFYGFEAMALVLDAIAAGAGDRAAIVRAARATRDRERSGDEASGRGRNNLMPLLVDCARAHATEGEIVLALQDVWGSYTETPVF